MERSGNEEPELLLNETGDGVLEDIQDFDDSLFELDEEELEAADENDSELFDETNNKTKRSSGSEIFQCGECAYSTSNYSRYKKHVQYHSMPLIKCEKCEFRTPYKWNLDRHMRNHNEDGQFKCNRCSFSANIKQSLSFHVQNHHLHPSMVLERLKAKNNRGGSHNISMFRDLENTEDLESDIILRDLSSDDHMETNDGTIDDENADLNDEEVTMSKAVKIPLTLPSEVSIKRVEKSKDIRTTEVSVEKMETKSNRESNSHTVMKVSTKVSAIKIDKTSAKRPPPCLIPLSKHSGFPVESIGSAVSASAADGVPPADSAVQQSVSVLDRLFNKRMAASSGSDSVVSKCDLTLSDISVKPANVQSSSNRCPYCRHRCKTTDDLRNHKKTCLQAPQTLEALLDGEKKMIENDERVDDDILIIDERNPSKSSQSKNLSKTVSPPSAIASSHISRSSVGDDYPVGGRNPSNTAYNLVRRRVFKCPHCSFWATTASRFHVHLVGHMNMRPYECSICSYRSNWRWDITKHIRLKSSRDNSHNRAKLIIRDEGNMRDYDRYDEYLVVMDVEEGLQCKPQEALLSKKSRVSPPSPGSSGKGNLGTEGLPSSSSIPAVGLFGSGIGMTPMPSSDSMFRGMPLLPPPTRFVLPVQAGMRPPMLNTLLLPQVQSVRLPSMPGMMGVSPLFFSSDMTVTKVPSSAMVDRFPDPVIEPRDITLTPSLESLKQMDPSLAAMGLTSENTAIVLPEPPPDAQSSDSGKKLTVWRCKKCPFKHREKRAMLAHVALHSSVEQYNCGHCGKPSNSESVLRRHCRNKHGGVVSIVENKSKKGEDRMSPSDAGTAAPPDVAQCPLCPFTSVADASGDEMRAHMGHHAPTPGAALKCTECPYYVSTKKALVEHMTLHGVVSPVKDVKAKSDGPLSFVRVGEPVKQDRAAPYRCLHCAFSTHMKTQLLSHRQFHALRRLPYQCPCCTFNVNQRSQMAEHVRLHGLRCGQSAGASACAEPAVSATPLPSSSPVKQAPVRAPAPRAGSVYSLLVGEVPVSCDSLPRLADADTAGLPSVPLVWASRGDRLFRAYKCRHCPHLSVVRAYIEQHERLHVRRDASFGQQCSACGYVCITAAVLAGHRRVHQYSLGRVHALVVGGQSEHDQLRQLLPEEQRLDARVQVVGVGGARVQPRSASPEPLGQSAVSESDARTRENSGGQDGGSVAAADEATVNSASDRTLYFCQRCPARFFHEKEIAIHSRFHSMNLPYGCDQCTYMARQQSHLLAHFKVHSTDYHRRTRSLLSLYGHSQSHPPRAGQLAAAQTASDGSQQQSEQQRSAAVVREGRASPLQYTRSGFVRRFSCPHCPARFVKEVTLRYHLTLHGSGKPFGCPYCDYAVKAQSHLIKHLSVHEKQTGERSRDDVGETHSSDTAAADDFPMSGVDLLKRKIDFEREQQQQGDQGCTPSPRKTMRMSSLASAVVSPERAGNPNFEYPTVTDKMGRERPRRYKCPKCPSAFEKRDQFFNHLGLHGARNRYRCTVCDYSVKFWANYLVHMRCHGIPATTPAEAERHQQSHLAAADAKVQCDGETTGGANGTASALTIGKPAEGEGGEEVGQKRLSRAASDQLPPELSDAEKQQLILQQLRAEQDGAKDEGENGRRWSRCQFCPYASTRRDHTENHRWRHVAFGGRGSMPCRFCDYMGFQGHLMREHHRLHFLPARQLPRVDTFTQLVQLQVYMKEVADTGSEDGTGACFEDVDTSTHDTLFDAEAEGVGLDDDWEGASENDDDVKNARSRVLVDMSTGDVIGELAAFSDGSSAAVVKTDQTGTSKTGKEAVEVYDEKNSQQDPLSEVDEVAGAGTRGAANSKQDEEQEEEGETVDDEDYLPDSMVADHEEETMNERETQDRQGEDISDHDGEDLLGSDDDAYQEDMGQEPFAEEEEDISDEEDDQSQMDNGEVAAYTDDVQRQKTDYDTELNSAERAAGEEGKVGSRPSGVTSPPAAMTAV